MTDTTTSIAGSGAIVSAPPHVPRAGFWLPAASLWQREVVRFLRQKNRVLSSVLTPLIFWGLLGSGLDRAVVLADGGGYREYFFPGTVVLMLMFTAIFSTISVIEDRREGFLQGVLVAPVPRLSIVMGKVLGGATIAVLQGVLFLLLWPLVGPWPGVMPVIVALGVMCLLAVQLTALGLCFAWPLDSTAGFHAVMNLVLFPMWFLSGAVFPIDKAPLWMRAVMYLNPLTYGQSAFTLSLYPASGEQAAPLGLSLPWLVVICAAVTIALCAAASFMVSRPRKDGLA